MYDVGWKNGGAFLDCVKISLFLFAFVVSKKLIKNPGNEIK